ncbi:MAG: tRNA lysidine(34) synthetase TilS [Atopococcus tabaci]|uniref:tRNA(Ile)-lysidine synthase n=1 Tax=Atopococcus tabaci TaxID=269774 RepID=A0AA43ZSE2_9LACT|nr:tRNA lysidine(34) synthetase TilS [Atopococcus tabaci]
MNQRFKENYEKKLNLTKDSHILLALSGGVDSMVLLHLLLNLPSHIRPSISLAYVNHRLRPESDAEAEFIKKIADQLCLPLSIKEWKNPPDSGIEKAARDFRYQFFAERMEILKAETLMTGHHRSDQLETLLMRFVRGGSWERLGGIRWSQIFSPGCLVRPLLSFTKAELYDYAQKENIRFVEDASNEESEFTRNRFRNQIIPLLKEENPQVEYQVQALAEEIQSLSAVTEVIFSEKLTEVTSHDGKELDRKLFMQESEDYRYFILKLWLFQELADQEIEISNRSLWDILRWIQEGQPNSRFNLPNAYNVFRSYEKLTIEKEVKLSDTNPVNELVMNEWCRLSASESLGFFEKEKFDSAEASCFITVNREDIDLPLFARHRKDGDRMTLKGSLNQSKKIKDIFIDQKVPLEKRNHAWIIQDISNRIIWLVTYKESVYSVEPSREDEQYVIAFHTKRGELTNDYT